MPTENDATETVYAVMIGTGAMTPGIAAEYARVGPTQIAGRDDTKIAAALDTAHRALTSLVNEQLLDPAEAAAAHARLSGTTIDNADYARATVVVESIVEDLTAKQALFALLDARTSPTTLLCSNTSSLPITAIAAECTHPERVIGTHYWNPPHLLPLVEVIPGERTSPETVAAVRALLGRMEKEPVQVRREVPGFIWNRLQLGLLRECLWLVSNGVATPEDIDAILERGLGRRWSLTGPFTTVRLGGSHVFTRIAEELFPEFAAEPVFPDSWQEILTTSRPDIDSATARAKRERALAALRRNDLEMAGDLNHEGTKSTKEEREEEKEAR
ncbi:MAG: 3-hydroxyacyl-CoA dehydrogenase family protein [Chloroflexota bacterium]|nr:3-hydroxyacyl-CoA dehydrogenase family protein [Chloroflexota bacterium]